MSDHDSTRESATRRELLATAAAVTGGAAFAGCSGVLGGDDSDDGGGQPTDTAGDEPTSTAADATTAAGPTTADPGHSVTMAPMGTVEFDAVPETWTAYNGDFADMAVALGHGDSLAGVGYADRYYRSVYDELPGVAVNETALEEQPAVRSKEQFIALDADVQLYDPQMLVHWFDWDEADVEDVVETAGPFVGNLIFRRSDSWHDYRYYTLYEAFETVANVFQETARYEAIKQFHDEFIAALQTRLPAAGERPSVMLTFEGTDEPETFSPYRLNDQGTSKKQFNDLGVADALAGTGIENLSTENRGELDYENLLTVDPDVLLIRGHERKTPREFRETVLAYMEAHNAGSQLTAVQNGRVYRGGFLYQGPIQNIFQTERAAQQLFPEEFGAVTSDEQLFDRDALAALVTDDVDG